MAQQYIYQMQRLTKRLDDGRELLSNFWLSFYPGAKIGIIGHNGAGKSTILRIMAGVDQEVEGQTWIDPEAKVGYLEQEPQLNSSLNVRQNVEQGLAHLRALLNEYDEINDAFETIDYEDMDAMDALLDRQASVQDAIDAADAWELDRRVDIAMDALRVPDGDSSVEHLSGGEKRRALYGYCCLSQTCCCLMSRPTI